MQHFTHSCWPWRPSATWRVVRAVAHSSQGTLLAREHERDRANRLRTSAWAARPAAASCRCAPRRQRAPSRVGVASSLGEQQQRGHARLLLLTAAPALRRTKPREPRLGAPQASRRAPTLSSRATAKREGLESRLLVFQCLLCCGSCGRCERGMPHRARDATTRRGRNHRHEQLEPGIRARMEPAGPHTCSQQALEAVLLTRPRRRTWGNQPWPRANAAGLRTASVLPGLSWLPLCALCAQALALAAGSSQRLLQGRRV